MPDLRAPLAGLAAGFLAVVAGGPSASWALVAPGILALAACSLWVLVRAGEPAEWGSRG